MSYSEKYFHEYCDSFGVVCRISIQEFDFEGSAIEMEGQPLPFVVSYDNSDDFEFTPIRPSTGEAFFSFGTENLVEFEEMWTADERKFKMVHYINGVVDWIGFVIPESFEYNLTGGVYFGVLRGADGLSTLESLPFVALSGEPYGTQDFVYNNGFEFPFSLIATEILRKLDLDLDTWICVDVYERTMTKTGDTRNADPLSASFANVKTYIGDSERRDRPYWRDANAALNCLEVMENLCYMFGAKVYQSEGVWRIKRINADADYGTGNTQRYWRKYNTLCVYLGLEPINDIINVACDTIESAMIGTDHLVRMGLPFESFRMNYPFQLLRTGDTPISLIKNGDFSVFPETSKLAAPPNWWRWRENNNLFHQAMTQVDISSESASAGGNNTALELHRNTSQFSQDRLDDEARPWSAIRYRDPIEVTKDDELTLEMYVKFKAYYTQFANEYFPFFRCVLETSDGLRYYLVNNPTDANSIKSLIWEEDDQSKPQAKEDIFFVTSQAMSEGSGLGQPADFTYKWHHFVLTVPSPPKSGQIIFDIIGLGQRFGKPRSFAPELFTRYGASPGKLAKFVSTHGQAFEWQGGVLKPMLITGISLGRIPDPDEFPEEQDFIYDNPNPNYSFQQDPIEVLNGDVNDPQHVSRIIVPSNVGSAKNFWDTIDDKYGLSSLGLITVKSIMNIHLNPYRILEGTIKQNRLKIDSVYVFEALPGLRFSPMSGVISQKLNYFQGTWFEISNVALPEGGTEGQNNTLAQIVLTGRTRCEKDGNGLNTGIVEVEIQDINPNSPSYLSTQWISDFGFGNQDLEACPIGLPTEYYWGTDDGSLDVSNLESAGFEKDGNEVRVSVNNTGGKFIYFLHLSSLGLVESIETGTQDEVISDFQYLSDIIVGGFEYRVLRQDFVTADFDDFLITFKFNQ